MFSLTLLVGWGGVAPTQTQTQTQTHRHKQTHRHTDTHTHGHTDTETHRHTKTHTHDYSDVLYVVAVFHYIFCTNKFSCKANRSPLTITPPPPINPTFIIYFGRNTLLKKQRSKQLKNKPPPARPPITYNYICMLAARKLFGPQNPNN